MWSVRISTFSLYRPFKKEDTLPSPPLREPCGLCGTLNDYAIKYSLQYFVMVSSYGIVETCLQH